MMANKIIHNDDRINQAHAAVTHTIVEKFGDPDTLSADDAEATLYSVLCIHTAGLIEGVARFKSPAVPLRDAVIQLIDLFLDYNDAPLADVMGDADPKANLDISGSQATPPNETDP